MASEAGAVILQLFVLFAAAKVLGGLGGLVRIPSVVGEILAGVIIGNTFLRDSLQLSGEIEFLEILAELGVVFLIFTVGLETPFEEMKRVGKTSLVVAILGVVLPFVAGYAIMAALGSPTIEGLFLGAALVATSVGITARVLAEMGVLGRTEARIILGAAVIDDVLGLMVLTVVQALGQEGSLDPIQIAILLAQALIFVGLLMYFGGRLVRRVLHNNPLAERWEWTAPKGPMFAIAVVVCLGLSAGAALIGLAAIIGAFLAGMSFAASDARHDLVERFEGIVQFLTPFFFGFIGLQVDLGVALSVWHLALGVTVVALLTKVVGCGLGALALGKRSAFAIGVGMMPRGEVGIIVALIGLSMAAIPEGLYAVVVAMSLLTTLLTPPILVWAFRRLPPAQPERRNAA
ncbi:MAG TPA: cation:proton antiporter [Candidatus Thermoplasmatota archaeon]|nr:cation:proton antiporter [Candidatus Thermoplasmatota archaeon]